MKPKQIGYPCLGLLFLSAALVLFGCSSGPKTAPKGDPAWIHSPTRTVDSGYIVYVGSGEDILSERATFKAESLAIADLANECSFVPKGARIEDRFDEAVAGLHHVYAKIGITFEECEEAKKTVDPQKLKEMANVAMTQQLKRYQDTCYVAEVAAPVPDQETAATPSEVAQGPRVAVIRDAPDFFILRQQVVLAKQDVILAPSPVYAPGTPQNVRYARMVTMHTNQIQQYEAANPSMRMAPTTWSSVESNPQTKFPAGFAHRERQSVRPYSPGPRPNPTYRPPPNESRPFRPRRERHRR